MELPLALPRSLRVRAARAQAKIQAWLTTPRTIELDQQTLAGMVPQVMQAEFNAAHRAIELRILEDLNPENSAGDAWRDARRGELR